MNRHKTFLDYTKGATTGSNDLLRVCIATPDFLFFVKNMGIGTSFYHTAQVLKKNNFDVTILYCNLLNHMTASEIESANSRITESGLRIDYLFDHSFKIQDLNAFHPNDLETVSSYMTYTYLKRKHFDILLFPDWRGLGFYTLQAKKMGLAFTNTPIWVQAHSTCLWHGLNNEQCDYNEHDVRVFSLERKSVELADLVVSPTNYLLHWMKDHGFVFPNDTFAQPCLLTGIFEKTPTRKETKAINELVFFGRLEKRKGLHLFLQSLKIIHGELFQNATPSFTITFLGKITEIEGMSSYDHVVNELAGTHFTLQFLTSFNSVEAVSYLKTEGKLAIIPSIADNSPFTVLECIHNEIPFIASDAGGIPEIVNTNDHEHTLFLPNPHELANKIIEAINYGAKTSFPAVSQSGTNIPEWLDALRLSVSLHKQKTKHEIHPSGCPVSVCITQLSSPQRLSNTLAALTKQTFSHFEVIIVYDSATSLEIAGYLNNIDRSAYPFPVKVIRRNDKHVGTSLNTAVTAAQGEFIIRMNDADYPSSDHIQTYYSCMAHSEYDALSCVVNILPQEDSERYSTVLKHYIPLGSGIAPNIFGNFYGDANCIVRKDILLALRTLSTEEESITWEGNELFSRIELSGGKTAVVPEPLLHVRETKDPTVREGNTVSNYYKALRPVLASFPWNTLGDALLISIGRRLQDHTTRKKNTRTTTSSNLINASEHSVLSLRWLTRRMSEVGDHRGVVTTMLSHYRASPAFNFGLLEFISYFLHHIGSMHEAKKYCRTSFEVDFIDNYRDILIKQNLDDLIDCVATRLHDSVDRKIFLARLFIMNGDLLEGLLMASTSFSEIDGKYLQKNSDILDYMPTNEDQRLNSCQFRSGVCHWLLHGKNEGRVLEYCSPIVSPITSHNNETVIDYQKRIEDALNCSFSERATIYSQLLFEALGNNSQLVLSDLATVILRDADVSYLETYPEVKTYTTTVESYTGIKHYIDFGRKEGRHSLFDHFDRNYKELFDEYCLHVLPKIATHS